MTKKPRICEHEEELEKKTIAFWVMQGLLSIEIPAGEMIAKDVLEIRDNVTDKIIDYLNTKPCAKCSKKKV